jgi:hypothetical protein
MEVAAQRYGRFTLGGTFRTEGTLWVPKVIEKRWKTKIPVFEEVIPFLRRLITDLSWGG